MTPSDFVNLPAGVKIVVAVLLWPAIWAGASLAVTLAGDVIRQRKQDNPSADRPAM